MAKQMTVKVILGLALLLGACAPADGRATPTEPIEIQPGATEPLPAPTPVTPPGSETSETPAIKATEPAMTQTTPGAQATAQATQAQTDEQPIFMRLSDLLGYEIVTPAGQTVGLVDEILADEAGAIQYVLADVGDFAGTGSQPSALPWSMFVADKDNQQVVFTGTAADLASTFTYDPARLDQTQGFVLKTDGTQLPGEFNDLIRASQYADFDMRSTDDKDLGAVTEMVLDVARGEVTYAFVDVTNYLDNPAETMVAVPWQRLALQEATSTKTDRFVLAVTVDTLQQAPTIDLNTLPAWPDLIDPKWDTEIRQFWENAG
jgi:sporulation protein YlmC with PRC-barrel domain